MLYQSREMTYSEMGYSEIGYVKLLLIVVKAKAE